MGRWQAYHEMVGEEPNPMIIRAIRWHLGEYRSAALDLGAGNFRDSKYLLAQGFGRVVAVDSSDESLPFWTPEIEFYQQSIETFEPPRNVFDFACACNVFFFLFEADVVRTVRKVREALHPGGVFVFNVLGPKDDWVTQGSAKSWFSRESVKGLCEGFQTLLLNEIDAPNGAVNRNGVLVPKYWHTFRLILRKS